MIATLDPASGAPRRRLAGPDVDAPGRLDQDEHVSIALEPAPQQHLLLVPPGQCGHDLARVVAGTNRQPVMPALVRLRLGLNRRNRKRAMRDQDATATFSATDRTMNAPPALRSAGRKPTPWFTAGTGPDNVTVLPLTCIVPAVIDRRP
jgi:hypothetical protein